MQRAVRRRRRRSLDGSELAHRITDIVEEHQASNISLLDLRDITPVADYFVICSVDSERQARALMEFLVQDLKQESVRPLSTEGEAASGWLLADYNTVVAHIFTRDARAYYRLDELWGAAPVVVRIP